MQSAIGKTEKANYQFKVITKLIRSLKFSLKLQLSFSFQKIPQTILPINIFDSFYIRRGHRIHHIQLWFPFYRVWNMKPFSSSFHPQFIIFPINWLIRSATRTRVTRRNYKADNRQQKRKRLQRQLKLYHHRFTFTRENPFCMMKLWFSFTPPFNVVECSENVQLKMTEMTPVNSQITKNSTQQND